MALTFLLAAALCLLPITASAGDGNLVVNPFHFGLGGLATWVRDAGEPGQQGDPQQYGLHLQKHTATSNFAAAGARLQGVTPLPAESLHTLSFDISGFPGEAFNVANGYCGAGAPRFNVRSDAGTCFLGCIYGIRSQDPDTGWWEIKFEPPFTSFTGCVGVTGTVTSISIVLDEGIDIPNQPPATGLTPGEVVLDNIRVNDQVVGKPSGN